MGNNSVKVFTPMVDNITAITLHHCLHLLTLSCWRRGHLVSDVGLINEANQHHAQLVLARVTDHLQTGKPSRYVTSQLHQLSLPSLRGG